MPHRPDVRGEHIHGVLRSWEGGRATPSPASQRSLERLYDLPADSLLTAL